MLIIDLSPVFIPDTLYFKNYVIWTVHTNFQSHQSTRHGINLFLLQFYFSLLLYFFFFNQRMFFLKNIIYLFIYFFRQGVKRKKERERSINVWLPLICLILGTWPATQVLIGNQIALIGNRIGDPLFCRPVLNPLSHTSQGYIFSYCYFVIGKIHAFLYLILIFCIFAYDPFLT